MTNEKILFIEFSLEAIKKRQSIFDMAIKFEK
jgi:hypothetical protein